MSRQEPPDGQSPQPHWDGTRWQYPSQGSPPPPHPKATRVPGMERARRPYYLGALAVVLVALVVLGSVVAVIAVRHSRPNAPGSATSAEDIFQLPYTRGVRSAEFRVQYGAGSPRSASGVIEFGPEHAFSETLLVGTHVSERWMQVGGLAYWASSTAPYQATESEADPFRVLGWDGTPIQDPLEVAGQTRFDGQQAWVVKKGGTGEKWLVAEHTGDPLEAVIDGDLGKETYTFSNWGRAPRIQAPSAGDISTERYRGSGSAPVVAPAATVRVLKAQPDSTAGGDEPAGFRTVALEISYKNTSGSSGSGNAPSLVSSDGVFAGATAPTTRPSLDTEKVLPGKTVTGWEGFTVPRQATSFHLLWGPQLDEAGTLDYLISISVRVPD